MPQIENVTQIKIRMLEGGHPNGVKHERETSGNEGRYRKAKKKEKSAILDEFIRLTGYHRKSAVSILGGKQVREVLVYADGEAVKLKPEKRHPANRKGKRIYTDEVIAALRLAWSFFWRKCGKIPASFM